MFDVDGDGTPELMTHFARSSDGPLGGGWFVLRYSPGASGASLSWQRVQFTNIGLAGLGEGLVLGDLNGDGLTDIWRDELRNRVTPRNEATVWLNAGGRFLASTQARPLPFDPNAVTHGLVNTALIDHDSDGRVDILEHWVTQPLDVTHNWVLQPNGFLTQLTGKHATDLVVRRPPPPGSSLPRIFDGPFDSVGDLDADGNPDLYGAANGTIFYGSGLHNFLLSTVKDGLGNVITVEYDTDHDLSPDPDPDPNRGPDQGPLVEPTYQTTESCRSALQWPDQCLKTMKGLVSRHSEGAYIGGSEVSIERTYDYKYVNARMNVTGHGWLGFERRSVTESDGVQYTRVTTDFEPPRRYTPAGIPASTGPSIQPPYLYPLAGLTRTVTVDRGYVAGASSPSSPLEDAPYARRSVVSNVWDVKLSADSRPFPVLRNAVTETFSRPVNDPPFSENGELRTSCTVVYSEFDGYGNHVRESSYCDGLTAEVPLESTETTTEFAPSRSSWLISNVELVRILSNRFDGNPKLQVYDPEYDSLGQLISVTRDPNRDAHRTGYVRDAFGNVERIEESAPGETTRVTQVTYGFDHVFPIRIENAKGHTTQVRFRPRDGQVSVLVDPNGVAVRRRYDGFGRQVETQSPSGVNLTAYATAAPFEGALHSAHDLPRLAVTSETRSADSSTFGGRSVQILDHAGRALRTVSLGFGGDEVVEERVYDNRGRVTTASIPHLALPPGSRAPFTAYQYDYLDRVTHIRLPDGTESERQYASGVSLASAHTQWLDALYCVDPDPTRCGVDVELGVDAHAPGEPGLRNVIVRDHAGLVVRSIDGENVDSTLLSSNYVYGAFNRLRAAADNGNAVTLFEHDDYGRLWAHDDPDSGRTSYTYTKYGELLTSFDPKGQLRTFSYDVLGRPERILDSDGVTTWTYDQGPHALGKLSESQSPASAAAPNGQRVRYAYDARGLVERLTYDLDSSSYHFELHYDPLARIDTIDYPHVTGGSSAAPIRAKYHYENASGALTALTENGSGTERPIWKVDAAYQGFLVAQQTFGNGAVSSFTYDHARLWLDAAQTRIPTPGGFTTIQDLAYTRYANGQVEQRDSLAQSEAYTYDALGRLATQTTFRPDLPPTGRLATYGYDVHGNLTQNDTISNVYNFYSPSRPHLPDLVGLNGYFHDLNGNLASRAGPDIPGQLQSFSYTPFDLPRTIYEYSPPALVELDYTADGTRVVRRNATSTTHFASQLYERTVSSDGTIDERFRFAAGSDLVAETVRTTLGSSTFDKTLYFHTDHLGTPETVSDDSATHQYQSYDAFGSRDPVGAPPSSLVDPTRIGFTSHLQESQHRLIDMGGRVYDPLAARFTTADPIMQAPYWSQGLNRYAYVFNDPINNTDPSGFITTGSIGGDIATATVAGVGWGTVLYGAVTELSNAGVFSSIAQGISGPGLTGGIGSAAVGALRGLAGGGPGAARPGGAVVETPAPSATPVTSPTKINGPANAPSQSSPPAPRPHKRARATPATPAAPPAPTASACDELCRNAPPGGYAPGITHKTFNQAASQVVDTSSTWQTAMEVLMAVSPVGPEQAVGALIGKAARGATALAKVELNIGKHAAEQMAKRGINESMVKAALEKGTRYIDPKNGTINYVLKEGLASGKDLLVGTNPLTGKITTVIRGTDLVSSRFIPFTP